MTDRELLELAAKAARKSGRWDGAVFVLDDPAPHECSAWSPLTDDGDRYRLIAKLRMSVDFDDCTVCKRLPNHDLIQEYWGGDCGDEPHAVLRAAAEIAKAMP